MEMFRRLMTLALLAGGVAGLGLSALQLVSIVPLIERAEQFEHADAHHAAPPSAASAWEPADGVERTAYTVLGTVLTGIGYGAVLFGLASLLGLQLDLSRGLLLGAAGFICCALAPSLGLAPKPPGAAAAELRAAQVWWMGTAIATAGGLWLLVKADAAWPRRIGGVAALLLPHLIGAPIAHGDSAVPADLRATFAVTSVATQGCFWLLLGALGGWLSRWMPVGVDRRL